jgi:hypothetical protein
MKNCYLDTTASSNGQERGLLDRLYENQPELEGARWLLVVKDPAQFDDLDGYDSDLTRVVAVGTDDPDAAERQVLAELDGWLKEIEDGEGLVCSFRKPVEERVAAEGQPEEQLRFLDLRQVLRPTLAVVKPVHEWANDVIPEVHAIALLLRVLTTADRPVRQTDVRPLLERLDPRFHRDRTRPLATDNPKMMGLLVDIARRRGLVETDGPSDNPFIKLTARGHSEYGRLSPMIRSGTPALGAGTLPGAPGPDEPGRPSDEYLRILKAIKRGPFQEVRGAVLDEMERLLPERPTLGALLDGAIGRVRPEIDAARRERNKKDIPWGQVQAFLAIMITRCKVMLNGDTPVTASARDRHTVVTRAADSWRVRLEAELVVLLLENGCTIDIYSHEDLAGALFNSRQDLQPVYDCIAHLVESGRCEESGDELTLTLVR